MTTVPPPGTPLPQMPAAPAPAPVVLILNPPPAVAALPAGTVLEAAVVAGTPETPQANVTLRTPQGDVQIRLPVDLPDNARVALEVLRTAQANTSTPQVTVRVVTVNDQPAAQVLAQLARQDVLARAQAPVPQQPLTDPQNPLLRAAVLPPGTAWTPAGPQQIATLATFSGFVVQGTPTEIPPPQQQPVGPQPTPVPAQATAPFTAPTASELSLRLTSVQLPQAAPAVPVTPHQIALVPASPGAATAAPAVAITTPPVVTVPLPVVAPTTAPMTAPQPGLVLPGPQGLPAAPPSPPPTVQSTPVIATVQGVVVNTSAAGAPVVTIDNNAQQIQVQLNVRANLPAGTRVTLEITGQSEPRPNTPPPIPVTSLPLTGPAGATVGWPTLTEAIAVLQRSDPQAAQQLAQAIPDGGPRTAAALMSFAQAMRQGDARQWPGDANLRALERSGPRGAHLASQLSDEVAALSSRTRDTGTEWRALPIPWNADGQIDRIALITRREGDADDDGKKGGGQRGTRFLINLDLTRLGALQLDGMFKKDTRAFDLMIRTHAPLEDVIRHDLTGIFAASNAAMGLRGGLTFQVVKKFADPIGAQNPFSADKSGLWA